MEFEEQTVEKKKRKRTPKKDKNKSNGIIEDDVIEDDAIQDYEEYDGVSELFDDVTGDFDEDDNNISNISNGNKKHADKQENKEKHKDINTKKKGKEKEETNDSDEDFQPIKKKRVVKVVNLDSDDD